MRLGLSLATIGVAVSVAVVAVGAHYLLGLPWELAVLLGAVTSPTDAAAVFSVLRARAAAAAAHRRARGRVRPQRRADRRAGHAHLAPGPSAEHGVLGTAGLDRLRAGRRRGDRRWPSAFGGAWVMRRAALPSSGLYPLAVLSLAFLAYGGAAAVHASGFAAVYVAALVLGNTELPHRAATRSFSEGVAWLAQIGLFVMLGLLLSPCRIDLEHRRASRVARRPRAHPGGPAAVGRSSAPIVQPMPLARAGVPLVGRAARRGADRAGHHPAGRGRRRRRASSSTSSSCWSSSTRCSPARRCRWVARGARRRPAHRAARPRGRGGAARADRRRPAAGDDHAQPRRCTASRSASSGCRRALGLAGGPDGETLVPERRTVLRHGDDLLVVTPRKQREATEAAAARRSPTTADWRSGSATRSVATRTRPDQPAAGRHSEPVALHQVASASATTDSTCFFFSDWNFSPTTTTMPGPSSSPWTTCARLNCRCTSTTAGLSGWEDQIWVVAAAERGRCRRCPARSRAR